MDSLILIYLILYKEKTYKGNIVAPTTKLITPFRAVPIQAI